MISRPRNYPHPVLTPLTDDVVPSAFELAVAVTADASTYYFDTAFAYSNATLEELVAQKAAVCVVHIECKRNFYRQIFQLSEPRSRLTISARDIVGRIEISGFIIACQTLSGYSISGSHPDYDGATFEVRAGDVLAVAPSLQLDAYVDYDPLQRLSSIMDIRRGDSSVESPMKVEFDDHRIVVTLSQPDYDRYCELKADPALGPLLANQVVVPALMEACHYIKATDDGDLELEMTRRWFRSVYKKLGDDGIDVRSEHVSALDAVQHILRLPLRRSLAGLIQLNPIDSHE